MYVRRTHLHSLLTLRINFYVKNSSQDSTTIAKSAGTVSIALMLSRILGLIREQVFAGFFGAGMANDAFVVAFRIPNLLRDLFGEGALSAAFVTVFSDYDQNKNRKKTWYLASNVLIFFTITLSIITLAAIFLSDSIVSLLAPDFEVIPGKSELTSLLTKIMMPFLVCISLSSVVMGILNTKKRFFVPALASSFFNLGSIIGGTSLALILPRWGYPSIVGMAIGTLIGGVLQFAIQVPTLLKCGFRFYPRLNISDPGLIRILKLMIPAVIGLSATQINLFINTNYAASCQEGSVSWLQYAFRLVQLPIGVFGVAIGIAVMPLLAKHAANHDISSLKKTFSSSLTMVFCLTVPAAAGLFVLSEPIIKLIFERGAFSAADTIATAQALSLYSIGLFAYSSNKVLVPAFYAIEKAKYPVFGSFIAVCTNIIFINLTIDYFQHRAIALSMSCTMLINFVFLSIVLYKKLNGFPVKELINSFLKIIAATSLMTLFLIYAKERLVVRLNGTFIETLFSLFGIIFLAVILYAATVHILKLSEFSDFVTKIQAKILKK